MNVSLNYLSNLFRALLTGVAVTANAGLPKEAAMPINPDHMRFIAHSLARATAREMGYLEAELSNKFADMVYKGAQGYQNTGSEQSFEDYLKGHKLGSEIDATPHLRTMVKENQLEYFIRHRETIYKLALKKINFAEPDPNDLAALYTLVTFDKATKVSELLELMKSANNPNRYAKIHQNLKASMHELQSKDKDARILFEKDKLPILFAGARAASLQVKPTKNPDQSTLQKSIIEAMTEQLVRLNTAVVNYERSHPEHGKVLTNQFGAIASAELRPAA